MHSRQRIANTMYADDVDDGTVLKGLRKRDADVFSARGDVSEVDELRSVAVLSRMSKRTPVRTLSLAVTLLSIGSMSGV